MYYSGVIGRHSFDNKEPFLCAIRSFFFFNYTSFENSVSTILLPIVVRDAGCILTVNKTLVHLFAVLYKTELKKASVIRIGS